MSTDQQDLSPEVQKAAIAEYALHHGIVVVDTYLDAGKSGLTLDKRAAMKRLLVDVANADREFSMVLVFDVSRWGRFQDVDASAYYEYHCRLHGVDVRYVQEPFSSDNSPLTALYKSMKRAMAAEFSRELAVKTKAGQVKAIQSGFQLGTMPCLGFGRVAVSKSDGSERRLRRDEHKGGNREHLRWVVGSKREVDAVRRIFELYAHSELSVVGLARLLRAEGAVSGKGQPITEWMLYSLLRSEAIVGDFVWGRAVRKHKRSEDDREFHRVRGALPPLVPRALWEAAQQKLERRYHTIYSREELVARLRRALTKNPLLRSIHLKDYDCPCGQTYKKEFGSLEAAWAAAGAAYPSLSLIDYKSAAAFAKFGTRLCTRIQQALVESGVECQRHTRADRQGQSLLINGSAVLRVQAIERRARYGTLQWELRKDYKGHFDWALIVRVESDGHHFDSLLVRRDEYFALSKWIPDQLVGSWQLCESMSDVATLLLSSSTSFRIR